MKKKDRLKKDPIVKDKKKAMVDYLGNQKKDKMRKFSLA